MLSRKLRIVLLRLVFIPFVAAAVFVGPSWPSESLIDFGVEWLGYLLVLAGLGVRLWSVVYLGGRKSRELVTEGPYSVCRNPLYWGTTFIAMGAGLCFENVPMAVCAVLIIAPAQFLVVRAEERHLKDIFGQQYEKYRNEVPGLLPSFRNYRSDRYVTVSTKAIWRAIMEAMLVVLIPLAGDFVQLVQAKGWVPVIWRFP